MYDIEHWKFGPQTGRYLLSPYKCKLVQKENALQNAKESGERYFNIYYVLFVWLGNANFISHQIPYKIKIGYLPFFLIWFYLIERLRQCNGGTISKRLQIHKSHDYIYHIFKLLNYVVHKNHAWFDNNALEKVTVRPKEPWRSGLKSFGRLLQLERWPVEIDAAWSRSADGDHAAIAMLSPD